MADSNLSLIGIPDNLEFDDSKILPEEGLKCKPTPTNAIKIWQERNDRSVKVAAAVAAIINTNTEYIVNLDIDSLDTFLKQILETSIESEVWSIQFARCKLAVYRKDYTLAIELLDSLDTYNDSVRSRRLCAELYLKILRKTGKNEEAEKLRRNLEIDKLLNANASPLKLRSKALALFKDSYCDEAERIYLHLIERSFELGSSHCHLARIYFMLNRFDDAFWHIEEAEKYCFDRSYVRARTLFLRILQCYLCQKPTGSLLVQLKEALSEPGAFEDWTMEPVIDHLKIDKQLPTIQAEILMTLIRVLSSVSNLSKLDTITSLDDLHSGFYQKT